DLPSKIGIALMMPLGGIALDDQIFAFDVTQAAQLAEKSAPCASPARLGQQRSRDCRMENRYSLCRRPLRCPRPLSARRERPQSRRTTEQTDELASPHMLPQGDTIDHGYPLHSVPECDIKPSGRSRSLGHQATYLRIAPLSPVANKNYFCMSGPSRSRDKSKLSISRNSSTKACAPCAKAASPLSAFASVASPTAPLG